MTIRVHRYSAPSAWASYLINNDASGFDYMNIHNPGAGDKDRAACDAWVDSLGFGRPVSCEDAGFMWKHDAHAFCPLGAGCQEYVFYEEVSE